MVQRVLGHLCVEGGQAYCPQRHSVISLYIKTTYFYISHRFSLCSQKSSDLAWP